MNNQRIRGARMTHKAECCLNEDGKVSHELSPRLGLDAAVLNESTRIIPILEPMPRSHGANVHQEGQDDETDNEQNLDPAQPELDFSECARAEEVDGEDSSVEDGYPCRRVDGRVPVSD